jgi:hypothetical protein
LSDTVQSSAICPSWKRLIVMPGSVTGRPRWVPCSVQRDTTFAPSWIWSTTSIRRSGNSARYSATERAMPSWPRNSRAFTWSTKSLA